MTHCKHLQINKSGDNSIHSLDENVFLLRQSSYLTRKFSCCDKEVMTRNLLNMGFVMTRHLCWNKKPLSGQESLSWRWYTACKRMMTSCPDKGCPDKGFVETKVSCSDKDSSSFHRQCVKRIFNSITNWSEYHIISNWFDFHLLSYWHHLLIHLLSINIFPHPIVEHCLSCHHMSWHDIAL